jgi:hypothetical protein
MNNPDHIFQMVPVRASRSLKQIMYKKSVSFGRKDTKFVSTAVLECYIYALDPRAY